MTILTAFTAGGKVDEKKSNVAETVPATAHAGPGSDAPLLEASSVVTVDPKQQHQHDDWYLVSLRRRRFLTSLCAALLILWLLLAAIAGSMLLFRYFHRRPIFYGWCNAQYLDESIQRPEMQQQQQQYGDLSLDNNNDDDDHRYRHVTAAKSLLTRFKERVEVDESEQYEKIQVPQFGPYRPGLFVHDFRQNLTAIVDLEGEQCFIKPLDRRRVAAPSGFVDLLRKFENGYYDQNSTVVRENFDVMFPPLTDKQLRQLGSYIIRHQCSKARNTYLLRKVVSPPTSKKTDDSDIRRPPGNNAKNSLKELALTSSRRRKIFKRSASFGVDTSVLNFIYYNGQGRIIKESLNLRDI